MIFPLVCATVPLSKDILPPVSALFSSVLNYLTPWVLNIFRSIGVARIHHVVKYHRILSLDDVTLSVHELLEPGINLLLGLQSLLLYVIPYTR